MDTRYRPPSAAAVWGLATIASTSPRPVSRASTQNNRPERIARRDPAPTCAIPNRYGVADQPAAGGPRAHAPWPCRGRIDDPYPPICTGLRAPLWIASNAPIGVICARSRAWLARLTDARPCVLTELRDVAAAQGARRVLPKGRPLTGMSYSAGVGTAESGHLVPNRSPTSSWCCLLASATTGPQRWYSRLDLRRHPKP